MIVVLLVLTLFTGPDIVGGPGQDVMDGTADGERFRAFGGADTIYGRAGSDAIYAGRGADLIYPGNGGDLVKCGLGDDVVVLRNHYGEDHYIGCEAMIA